MRILKFISILMIFGWSLSACSFRSTQLDLLRSALNPGPDEMAMEDLAWTLIWSGETYTVIPVFSVDGTIINFTALDGMMVVSYDNNYPHIVASTGLLPIEEIINVVRTDAGLEYSRDETLISVDRCEEFTSTVQSGITIWTQDCVSAEGSDYSNEIQINSDGAIVLLRFVVHPDYPMVSLTPDNLNF